MWRDSLDEHLDAPTEEFWRKCSIEELASSSDEEDSRRQVRAKITHRAAALVAAVPRSPPSACELPETCQLPSFNAVTESALFTGSGGSAWGAAADASSTAWDDRLRMLTTRDLLIIHKQFAQQAALLLVSAEVYGPGSPAFETLARLDHAYISFIERARALSLPEIWAARSMLDAETMSVIRPPAHDTLMSVALRSPRASLVRGARAYRRFEAESTRLKAEHQRLLQRLGALQLSDVSLSEEAAEEEVAAAEEGGRGVGGQTDPHPGTRRADESPAAAAEPLSEAREGEEAAASGGSSSGSSQAAAAEAAAEAAAVAAAAELKLLLDANEAEQWATLNTFAVAVASSAGPTTRATLILQLYPCE